MPDQILDEADAIQKIKQLGGTFDDVPHTILQVNMEPIPTVVIPYWAITISLTLVSTFLLFGKQRSTSSQSKPT